MTNLILQAIPNVGHRSEVHGRKTLRGNAKVLVRSQVVVVVLVRRAASIPQLDTRAADLLLEARPEARPVAKPVARPDPRPLRAPQVVLPLLQRLAAPY